MREPQEQLGNAMRDELEQVLRDFVRIPSLAEAEEWRLADFEFSDAPHQQPAPLSRHGYAVYLFFRGRKWLRIGKTGHSPRFTSQHYGVDRAGSNFAKDVWGNREEFNFNGNQQEVGDWIKQNCGRANIRLPTQWPERFSLLLESYLHYRLVPRFEGKRRNTGPAS